MPNTKMMRWIQVVIAACLLLIVFVEYVRPFVVDRLYEEEFKRLSLECDQAMHNEVAIRSSAANNALPETVIISSAVELAVCHQYDKLRKKLLIWGVSEERLALLGLESLESERIPVGRMVDPHRMPRF